MKIKVKSVHLDSYDWYDLRFRPKLKNENSFSHQAADILGLDEADVILVDDEFSLHSSVCADELCIMAAFEKLKPLIVSINKQEKKNETL